MILGLAPAAHGGNRTGRIFTGDRSGDFLFASLHRTGFANQATSVSRDDGLELHGAWVTAVNRCAPPGNKPTPQERDTCLPFLVRELDALDSTRVIVALGAFAWDGALRALAMAGHPVPRPRPRFGHAAEAGGWSVHPARLLPPEPAEHVHGHTHRAHDRRGVRAGPSLGVRSGGSVGRTLRRAVTFGGVVHPA